MGFTLKVKGWIEDFVKAAEASKEEIPKAAQGSFTRLKLLSAQKPVKDVESSRNSEGLEKLQAFLKSVKGKAKLETVAKKAIDNLTEYFGKDYGAKGEVAKASTYVCPKCGYKGKPDKDGNCPKCGTKMKVDYGKAYGDYGKTKYEDYGKTEVAKSEPHPHGKHVVYCPKCGYEETVEAGVKAKDKKCPKCGTRMRAREIGERREAVHFRTLTGRLLEAVEGTEGSQWEVTLIEAGVSENRTKYSLPVLEKALPLFDGAKCFADHSTASERRERPGRSIRDIVGWFESPKVLGDGVKGIGAVFNILESERWFRDKVVEAWERGKRDLIGFSISAIGRQKLIREEDKLLKEVVSIDKVQSVDAVTEPAAGGKFVKMLEGKEAEEVSQLDILNTITLENLREVRPDLFPEPASEPEPDLEPTPEPETEPSPDLSHLTEAVKEIESLKATLAEMQDTSRKTDLKAQLDSALQSSGLPKPVQDKLGRRFSSLEFTSETLTEAIREEKEVLAQILPPERRYFPSIKMGESERDKIDKAMDGLLEGEDIDGIPRFRNLREAYSIVTGTPILDVRAQHILNASSAFDSSVGFLREEISTSTWTNVFGTSMTRRLLKEYRKPGYDDWKKICSSVETLDNMKSQERVRIGGYVALSSVSEGSTYTEQSYDPPNEMQNYTPTKKGNLESITLKAIANDDLGALRRIPKAMAFAAKVGVYKAVFDVLTTNAAMNYDSVALFNAASHGNYGTTALSYEELTSAKNAMLEQMEPVGSGGTELTYLDVEPKYLLVPLELRGTAWDLINSPVRALASSFNATQPNMHYKTLELIVVRHWTDSNNWYLIADPSLIATIEVGFYGSQEPEIFTELANAGSNFTADKLRYKIRHIYGVAALEHRGMYAEIV